ncbi:hypothetical protein LUZ63_012125 [Rhynchospora breviuscula]|uniref:Cation/H+ exchanger domain-containing protein n=1 Tax=Rhynchospora breviuscula TaxID=2022672 RepID=A0A9Q0HR75_9POAL|nr:hypothetical protein LUZ63_012125 [Rhynchospora breviuscula]
MAVNITSIKTSSNGIWQGDDPLHFAFPLLILQTVLVLVLSRLLAFLFRPLRQPKVIAEIIAGIILGPSAIGRNQTYLHTVFPSWSTPILESVANIGLLFFLFLVGLELDLKSIRRSGRHAFSIAAAGITLPFACGVGVAFVLRSAIPGADQADYAPFLVFMGVSLSITAFPVLARILAELKLLTTRLGETAMAAAAFNDVAAWILLALAVALSGGEESHHSPIISLWVLLSGLVFVAVQIIIIKPCMSWVARRSQDEGGESEFWISLTLAGVLISGFMTDFIGIHSIFGGFVFGLMIPKEGEFTGRLIERIEDFVSGLLLPLYFASSGLKTNVASIKGGKAWGLLCLVIVTACAGKILGTFVVALGCKMSLAEAITLGFLMNTKGLVELIVLNIGKEKKVLNDETFAILVLMALFTTFITTPTVMAIYKPARPGRHNRPHRRKLQFSSSPPSSHDTKELRVLTCVHTSRDIPSLINLIETMRGQNNGKTSHLKLYILRLVELTERSSSIRMVRSARHNGLPIVGDRRDPQDHVAVAFGAYAQLSHVHVRPITAISSLSTMHEDVCTVADQRRVSLIVLPFHRHRSEQSGDMENSGPRWRAVNSRVLREAPCSVALLVDRGFGGGEQVSSVEVAHGVCVVFFGGPDDREALELAGRMAEHPGVCVTALRFVSGNTGGEDERQAVKLKPAPSKNEEQSYTFSTADVDIEREKELDEAAITKFQQMTERKAQYEEKLVRENVIESVLSIGRSGDFGLIVVGKGRFPTSSMVAKLAGRPAEHPELGPIGDALVYGHGVVSSVLVVQQHDMIHSDEMPVTPVPVHDGETTATDGHHTMTEP